MWWAGQMSIFQNLQATFLEPLSTGLNHSLWTIPIELEFYIVLPALYGILRLHRYLGNMRLLAIALAKFRRPTADRQQSPACRGGPSLPSATE